MTIIALIIAGVAKVGRRTEITIQRVLSRRWDIILHKCVTIIEILVSSANRSVFVCDLLAVISPGQPRIGRGSADVVIVAKKSRKRQKRICRS